MTPDDVPAGRPRWVTPALLGLLAATAVLYLWGLGSSGWANSYYAAAAQAGTQDLTAWLFGSLDPGNAITVDKPPAAMWVMALSGRLFGFSPFTMLLPQALMGVGAVALLYAAVRRCSGPAAGLIAGAALALTPVAALMFRYNNPDALLVLLLVAAAYCVVRATETASTRWMALAGCALGFAFLTKMLQAFLVAPGLALGIPGRRTCRAVAADLEADGRCRRTHRFVGLVRGPGQPVAGSIPAVHRRLHRRTACYSWRWATTASSAWSAGAVGVQAGVIPARATSAPPSVAVPGAAQVVEGARATCSSAAIRASAGCSGCRWVPRRLGCFLPP